MFVAICRAAVWGAVLLISALAGTPAHAAGADLSEQKSGPRPAEVTECDRLAQPTRAAMGNLPALVDGVSRADLRWPAARAACASAMEQAPSEVRFVAFAARAADKGEMPGPPPASIARQPTRGTRWPR